MTEIEGSPVEKGVGKPPALVLSDLPFIRCQINHQPLTISYCVISLSEQTIYAAGRSPVPLASISYVSLG